MLWWSDIFDLKNFQLLQLLGKFITASVCGRLETKIKSGSTYLLQYLHLSVSELGKLKRLLYASCCAYNMERANQSCDRLIFCMVPLLQQESFRKKKWNVSYLDILSAEEKSDKINLLSPQTQKILTLFLICPLQNHTELCRMNWATWSET